LNKIKGKKNTDINIKLAIGAMFLLENNFKLAKKELEEICNVENVNDKTLIINKVNVKEYLRSIRYRDAIFECMFNNAYVNSKLKNNNEALKILNYYLKLNAEDAAAKELRKKVVMDLGLMNESISNDTSDLKRLGDYYLLMNTYSSRGDYVKENYLEDLMKKRFKNTILNFKKIIALAKKNKTKIIFVQYPDFKLKHLKSLLPIDEKLTFVDNESLFINNPKNTYIFEARYPYKFNHFTQEGARLLAEKIGKVAIKVIEDDLAFSKK
jgi:tetratricopeptide (TPR) repeat protein